LESARVSVGVGTFVVVQNKGGTGEDCLHQTPPSKSYNIQEAHLADVIAELTERKAISITEV
jgi:hypothetical protein